MVARRRQRGIRVCLWGIGWVIAALSLSPAASRPFVVDDLLRVEEFAQIRTDPTGRWLVIEQREAAGSAPRFDLETHQGLTLGRLLVVDLDAPAVAQPLIAAMPGTGYVMLAFSPRGGHLAVARLHGRIWELGIVDMAARTTRWLGLTPGLAGDGRAVQWLSETRLAAIVYAPGELPVYLRAGWQTKHDLPLLWERAATGLAVTATTVGSGRFRSVTPRRPAVDLVSIDLASGSTRTVTTGAIVDFEAASTGRIAVLTTGDDIVPTAAPLGVGTPTQRLRLSLIDADATHSIPGCSSCDFAGSLLRWSPSGHQLLAFVRQDGAEWSKGHLVAIDGASGRATPLGAVSVVPVIAGPPNFAPIIHADWMGETALAYATPVDPAGHLARPGWFALDAGSAIPLTPGREGVSSTLAAVRASAFIVRDGDQMIEVERDGRTNVLWSNTGLHLAGSSVVETGPRGRTNPSNDSTPVFWSNGRGGLIVRFPDSAAQMLAGDLAGGSVVAAVQHRAAVIVEQTDPRGLSHLFLAQEDRPPVELATINRYLASVESARMVAVAHVGAKGQALTSWLFLPANRSPGQRFPLVVIPYPGRQFGLQPPQDQLPGAPLDSVSAQVLAGSGYAVLLPSLPADSKGLDAAGLTAAVSALVDRVGARDDIDLSRLALWGHSFGASAAVAIAAHTRRFGSVIASGGLYDLISAYGTFLPLRRVHPEDGLSVTTMAGWSETGQAQLGAPPWIDPAVYIARSPLFAAASIQAPVLLMQGDQDIAALGQAEEMFSALYRQNKDAELVSYWGEGHVVDSPADLRDLYARVIAWLGATLGHGDPAVAATRAVGGAPTTR